MTHTDRQFPEIYGYTITEQLYLGSRTLVYRAVHDNQQLPVVIKVLQREYPTFGELVQFRNQYAIAKNLSIAGIIQPLSLETFGNGYALMMADWGGVSLEKYIQQHQLDIAETLAIAIQLADILHELHSSRVIHKDIKPANILIHPDSQQVKLIDFSIASLLPKETQEIQNPNVLEGTLAYLAPEQTGRMNRGIDYRSDFYAFGVTLYQLLTGCLPFIIDDPLELVHCHIAKIATPVHQVNTDVPKILGTIVAKLMAKNAEDRYQSALGLKYDLGECLNQWKETGAITEFELAQRDLCDRFLIPEKLYGREEEVQTLLDAFDRVADGASEMMLVAGFSGIGKTAVVNEVHKPIVKQRGYFIKGKFDQFNRNIPFSAFVQALRDLMGQLLSESDAQLQTWKNKILEALGENAQVIVELIPELERIIGNQPPALELSGTAAQNRFNLLLQRFIQVFTTTEHPLVMFLDDLQWADSASLNLIQVLMSEVKMGCLLLLGAYRDNEVFAAHPLMLTLNDMEKTGATIHTITLEPLNFTSLNSLVADTLHGGSGVVKPLTELVMQKTQGNPFFATQFLKALYQDQLITFDRDAGHWQCDIVQVRDAALTDDVVELMALQLQKLPEATQEILKLAACIGAQFDLETLAIVSEQAQTEVATALWRALQEGLILPITKTYKFFQGTDTEPSAQVINVPYKFLHDRVQQAAYSLIPEDQKQATHREIGRLLLENISEGELEVNIFNIVNHWNIAFDLICDEAEKLQLVRLNQIAGRKAKSAIAYQPALNFFQTGISLLGDNPWQTQYDLTLSLYTHYAEVAYLAGEYEQMERTVATVLQFTQTPLEQFKVYEVRINAQNAQKNISEAMKDGRYILSLLGVNIPEIVAEEDISAAIAETERLLEEYPFSILKDLPHNEDGRVLAALQILNVLIVTAYQMYPQHLMLIILSGVNLSIRHGNTALSGIFYGTYGLVLCGALNQIEMGYEFGQLAYQLLSQFDSKEPNARILSVVGMGSTLWKRHLKECLPPLKVGYEVGLETGDLDSTCWNYLHESYDLYLLGHNLHETCEKIALNCQAIQQLQQQLQLEYTSIVYQVVLNLTTAPPDPCRLVGEAFNEDNSLPYFQQAKLAQGLCLGYLNKAILLYLFERPTEAWVNIQVLPNYIDALVGQASFPLLYFYDSLIRLAQPKSSEWEDAIAQNQAKLQNWADFAPMNFLHKFDLVEAEKHRVLGEHLAAIDFYDRAISGAKENEYLQEEALANELAAKFYLDWGKEKIAATYMQEAYYCYSRWGAKAKINDLEQRYPNLLRPILQSAQVSSGTWNTLMTIASPTVYVNSSTHKSSGSTSINQAFDFAAILKASQALSSTIELDQLLHQLTQIILQNSGGDRCALLLPNEAGEWQIRAIATSDDTQLCAEPLTNNPNLPVKLIQYVKNTQETVVIDDLKTDLPVIDNYLRQRQPKSLLCLPLLNQGQLIGILYLKNQFTIGAFTSDRVEVLNFLCTQAAISLKNAQLYQQAQEYAQQLEQSQLQVVQSEKMATLGNLVAGVAHEINNPLGFLNGSISNGKDYVQDLFEYLETYHQQQPPNPEVEELGEDIDLEFLLEDLPKLLESMKGATNRIKNISTSLRTFSRADTDHKVNANLHEGIDSTLLILKYRLKANNCRPVIQVTKDYGNLLTIECFPGQLNQVFMNILANAIDVFDEMAQTQSYEELEANPQTITIRTGIESNQVYIRIRDNGKGMSKDVQGKIFDNLFTTKEVGKGTGLGLAIARQIVVEKHGGSINVWSEPGQGTEFCLCLPIGNEGRHH